MIRNLDTSDIEIVNKYLKNFNYELNKENLNDEFLKVILYEENGIKGVLVYSLIYDRIEIDYIIVDKDYRRLGIATKLLKFLETNDIKNITLEVRESNIQAIKLYEKNGYIKSAIRKNYYKDENGILMIKKFGE